MNCDAYSSKKKKHPAQSVIDYVTNGDAPSLNKAHIARWADSPLLADNARVQAVRRLDPSFGASAVCLVRWLFEGAPHVFSDFELGRNIRRIINNNAAASSLWGGLPNACRRHNATAPFGFGYTEAVLFGSAEEMKREFEDVIERQPVVPGVTFFCTKCQAVSAISFEYDCALRTALFLPQVEPRSYYSSLAATHRQLAKKKEISSAVKEEYNDNKL
jgi:hypothetical protein